MKKGIVLLTLGGVIVFLEWKIFIKEIEKRVDMKEMSDKHMSLLLLLNQLIKLKQEGKKIEEYLYNKGIKSVAIYGISYVGKRLYDELIDSDIEIKYIIDKDSNKKYRNKKTYSPKEKLFEVDAVIVTPIFCYDDINEKLKTKVTGQILSIEDILYEL